MTTYFTANRVFYNSIFVENIFLGIDDEKISSIDLQTPKADKAEINNFNSSAIFPGTVNTHNHSFQSFLRGYVDDKGLGDWLKIVYAVSSGFDENACYLAGLLNFGEMVRNGTTTVADFFYLNGRGNENVQATIKAATDLGMRIDMGRTFIDAPWGGESTVEDVKTAEKRYRELVNINDGKPLVSIHPAPHSIYGASRSMIELAANLAEEFDTKWHMHLGDSKASSDKIAQEYGMRSVEILEKWGVLSDRFVGIHGMWLSEKEINILANYHCAISHNPASNLFLGEKILDIAQLTNKGICVGLGTDGSASNNSQNLFSDIRLVSLTQRLLKNNPQAISIDELINLMTANGASLLNLPVGLFEKGRMADFIVLNQNDYSLQPNANLKSNIIHSFSEKAITHVFCNGKQIVNEGMLCLINENELLEKVRKYLFDLKVQ